MANECGSGVEGQKATCTDLINPAEDADAEREKILETRLFQKLAESLIASDQRLLAGARLSSILSEDHPLFDLHTQMFGPFDSERCDSFDQTAVREDIQATEGAENIEADIENNNHTHTLDRNSCNTSDTTEHKHDYGYKAYSVAPLPGTGSISDANSRGAPDIPATSPATFKGRGPHTSSSSSSRNTACRAILVDGMDNNNFFMIKIQSCVEMLEDVWAASRRKRLLLLPFGLTLLALTYYYLYYHM